jgi:aminoglycoside phosphotransferase (APT) family kinase protein
MTTNDQAPGYDIPSVEQWIGNNIAGLSLPLTWKRLEGGHSNLTYLLGDASGNKAVIRRPPLGELLPKAHDMSREWALIRGLGRTPVPVPDALGFCDDISVTGTPFYVMGFVDGSPFYNSDQVRQLVPEGLRTKLAHSFIDVLADLHAVDPDAVGLGDLGKRDSYVGRQLRTWYQSWMASIDLAKFDDPRAHALRQFFLDNLPEQATARIVHGDYGLHNTLIGPDCTVAAVVDWEISTLGDPLADLAYALNWWHDPSDRAQPDPRAATSLAGFPSRSDLAERYARRTGWDLSNLNYYVGFNRWKTAAALHGVFARYMSGKKSAQGIDLDEMRNRISLNLKLAEEAAGRL